MNNEELEQVRFMEDYAPEVTGKEESTEIAIDLRNEIAEKDAVKITMRNGWTFMFKEIFSGSGFLYEWSIITEKGQQPFATFIPGMTGLNAVRVVKPTNV